MSSDDGSGGISPGEADHFQHVQQVDERIFFGIQIAGGHILLPILVLTILFSQKVTRHPVFIIFCISWILSSIIYSLLLYRGRNSDELLSLNPSSEACLIQAALLNGVQALTACTTFALVAHLYFLLRSFTASESDATGYLSKRRKATIYNCALLGGPFIVFVVFTLITMVIGSNPAIDIQTGTYEPGSNPSIPGVFFCVILQNPLNPGFKLVRVVLTFTCLISIITVGFEVLIARLVYNRRTFLKQMTFNWIQLFLRVVLFSLYRIVALSLNVVLDLHPDEFFFFTGIAKNNLLYGAIYYFQATIPLVAFLTFASEKDILSVWCFWRKDMGQAENQVASSQKIA